MFGKKNLTNITACTGFSQASPVLRAQVSSVCHIVEEWADSLKGYPNLQRNTFLICQDSGLHSTQECPFNLSLTFLSNLPKNNKSFIFFLKYRKYFCLQSSKYMSEWSRMRVKADISVFLAYTEVKVEEEKNSGVKTKTVHGPKHSQSQRTQGQLPGRPARTPRPAKQAPGSLEKRGASFLKQINKHTNKQVFKFLKDKITLGNTINSWTWPLLSPYTVHFLGVEAWRWQ